MELLDNEAMKLFEMWVEDANYSAGGSKTSNWRDHQRSTAPQTSFNHHINNHKTQSNPAPFESLPISSTSKLFTVFDDHSIATQKMIPIGSRHSTPNRPFHKPKLTCHEHHLE
jgi:hypothetical protein